MKFLNLLILAFLMCSTHIMSQALGYNNHRIAISADGNTQADNHVEARWPRADPDDWAGTPATLAMLAKADKKEQLVHFSYNNFIGAPAHSTETNHMDASVQGAIQRWGFDASKFFDVPENNAVAITHLANEIKKSTATDPLYFIHMGPSEFFYLAIKEVVDAGDLNSLSHIYVVSHSGYNDDHLRRFAHHTMNQTIALSGDRINYKKIQDQNACDDANIKWCSRENFTPYYWMRDSGDESLKWLYTRMQIPGGKHADISDAGMIWYLLFDDELGNPSKLSTFMGEGINPVVSTPCENINYIGIQDFTMEAIDGLVVPYKDTSRNAVAVNAGMYKDQFAAARKTHNLPTGNYDITITSLTEEDGECTYRLKVDGKLVGEFQNPEVDATGDMKPHTHTFTNVAIKKGEVFQIESNTHTNGKIPEGTSTAWARGRWRSVNFKCLNTTENDTPVTCTAIDKDGLFVFEAERFELKGDWKVGTDAAKASGGKYIYFDGPNSYNAPKAQNNISYDFEIRSAGTYVFKWTMRQPEGERGTDLGNDAWFYFSNDIALGKDKDKNDFTLDQFYKFVGRSADDFVLNGAVEANHNQSWVRVNFPNPGTYTLNLSGRSHGFQLDRLILFKSFSFEDLPSKIEATAETLKCSDDPLADPTSITLTPTPLEVRVGKSEEISVTVQPIDANPSVTWSSADQNVATVDTEGNVTGIAQGTTIITATSTIDNAITNTITVNVVPFYAIPPTSIAVTPSTENIFIGSPLKIEAIVSPANADNKNIIWSSSDESIATVDTNGNVTAIKDGVVTITATTVEGSLTDISEITVGTLVESSIVFDDINKYKTTSYYAESTMEVSVNFHAGSRNTVLSDNNNGIIFRLRELNSDWKVQKDYVANDISVIGQESGVATATISLEGITPTQDLSEGNFYFLFISFKTSDGERLIKVNTTGINVLESNLSVASINPHNKVSFYPNPVKNILYLRDDLVGEDIAIYSAAGKKVITSIVDDSLSLQVHNLPSGMYFIHVGNGIAKFIKE